MSRSLVLSAVVAGLSLAGSAVAEISSVTETVTIIPPQSFTGVVEVIDNDLLIKSIGGTHRFTGARACKGLVNAPFVHVHMTEQKIALGHGGKAQVVYGNSMASTRTCDVIYQGQYSPPSLLKVTPLEL
ncbi:hypothetical protein [Asticcacaulis sp.]|uniref:hypothetical protein n=1 Tax=Asticcacaulis sp. TaxID=1872648 RepID=UPI00262649FF|nr:hypothetical protein [Asticcacaulis sp.]